MSLPLRQLFYATGMAAALAFAWASVLVIDLSAPWATTYAGALPAALTANLAAGIGLMVAGTIVALQRRDIALGPLAIAAGVAWLSADWVGWQGGPPFVRSVAAMAGAFFLPLVLHAVALVPARPRPPLLLRPIVAAAYGAVALLAMTRALFHDPRLDRFCWNNCTDNAFLIASNSTLTAVLGFVSDLVTLALGIALVGVSLALLTRVTPAARRMAWVAIVPAGLVGASATTHAMLLFFVPIEGPQVPLYAALFQLRSWAVAALGLGLVLIAWQAHRRRRSVERLLSDLRDAPPPGSLAAAVGRAANDPHLDVAYWLPESGRFVDAAGQSVEPLTSQAGRIVTPVTRDRALVAAIVHDESATTVDRLEQEVGAAALLAIDNERLQAGLLAQLADLRAWRQRIVEAGDRERRRLERNLHDGAQQRLLALSYDLRVALAAARETAAHDLEARLQAALERAHAAIDELRQLAHGIYPSALDGAGLCAALQGLEYEAPMALEVVECPAQRLPESVERAIYVVVRSLLEETSSGRTEKARVRVSMIDDWVAVQVEGIEVGRLTSLADRVGALGGRVSAGVKTFHADIPCA